MIHVHNMNITVTIGMFIPDGSESELSSSESYEMKVMLFTEVLHLKDWTIGNGTSAHIMSYSLWRPFLSRRIICGVKGRLRMYYRALREWLCTWISRSTPFGFLRHDEHRAYKIRWCQHLFVCWFSIFEHVGSSSAHVSACTRPSRRREKEPAVKGYANKGEEISLRVGGLQIKWTVLSYWSKRRKLWELF